MTVSEVSTTTPVTRPPILDETGQAIAAAIRGLKNTDPTLSVLGKPADALVVGNEIERLEELINFEMDNSKITNTLFGSKVIELSLKNGLLERGGFSRDNGKGSDALSYRTRATTAATAHYYKIPFQSIIYIDCQDEEAFLALCFYSETNTNTYQGRTRRRYTLNSPTKYYQITEDDSQYYIRMDVLKVDPNNINQRVELNDPNIKICIVSPTKQIEYYTQQNGDESTILYPLTKSLITIDEEHEKMNIQI